MNYTECNLKKICSVDVEVLLIFINEELKSLTINSCKFVDLIICI